MYDKQNPNNNHSSDSALIVGILKLLITRRLTIPMAMDIAIPMHISVEKKNVIMVAEMIIVAMITIRMIIFVIRLSRMKYDNDSDV